MKTRFLTSALWLGLALPPALSLQAQPLPAFDGNKNLICAALDVVACNEDKGCIEGNARAFDLPAFLLFDFKQKQVRASETGGHEEFSPFEAVEVTDTQVILQGVENHHGWSANINRETGRVSVASIGPEVSYMIFGVCTTL